MPIAFRGIVFGGAINGGNVTLNLASPSAGSAPVVGDLVLIISTCFGRAGNEGRIGNALSYTQVDDTLSGTQRNRLASKFFRAGETGPVIEGSTNASDATGATAVWFSGVDGTNPFSTGSFSQTSGASTNPDAGAITPAQSNCMVVVLAASSSSDAAAGTVTNYTTQAVTQGTSDTNSASTAVAYRLLVGGSGASENPGAFSAWTTGSWIASTFALRPGANIRISPQSTDLPPRGISLESYWDRFYSQSLALKLPPPAVPADTTHVLRTPLYTPRYPLVWYRDWAQNLALTAPTAAAPFAQDDWPLSFAQVPAGNLRVWTQSYNLNLIGKDRLPVGEVVTDLTPRSYEHHVQLRSWAWSYNLNLIGKDRFPPGQVVYDLPPRAPQQAALSWTWNYNLSLIGQDRFPSGEAVYDLVPRAPQQPAQTWTWSYNLNLIGKDQLPIGGVTLDLPRQLPIETRSWIGSLNPLLAVAPVPFTQSEWPLPAALQQAGRTWTWSYNLNLIGKDQLPVGEIATDLPRQLPIETRTWLASLVPILIAAPSIPIGEIVTDLSVRAPQQPAYSWTWNYNLNLVGKDQLPVGDQSFDLPPRGYDYAAQLRTWLGAIPRAPVVVVPLPPGEIITDRPAPLLTDRAPPTDQQNLLASTLFTPPPPPDTTHVLRAPLYTNPRGPQYSAVHLRTAFGGMPPEVQVTLPIAQFDWPVPTPPSYHVQLRTWLQSPRVPTPAAKPFAQYDWPLPVAQRQPAVSLTASYNQNLIGKDKLPTGEIVTDLAPPLAPAIFQTWIQSVNLALTVTPPVFPAGKTSTALPAQPPRADLGFTESFNLSLIGQDRLPFRQTDWSLPIPPADGRTWIQSVNLALTVTPAAKPFNQTDWPIPSGAQQPTRGFGASFNLDLIGKDQLPNGEVVTDLAPRGPLTPIQLYTWVQTVNLALIAPPPVFPVGKTSLGLPTLRLVFTAPQDLPPQNIVILGPPAPPVVVPPGGGGELRYRWRWCDFTDREWFKAFCEEFYRLKALKNPQLRRQQFVDLEQALDLAIERAAGGSGKPEWTFDIRAAGGMLQDEADSPDVFDRIATGLMRLALEIDDEEAFLLLGS